MGAVLGGFTDHDTELSFEGGVVFQPETGMTAAALAQSTGLSVDNTEALGGALFRGGDGGGYSRGGAMTGPRLSRGV